MNLNISGKRCMLFTRANPNSGDSGAAARSQFAALQDFARHRQLEIVGHIEVVPSAKSRQTSKNAIDAVIQKKAEETCFDLLVITELSRLTRGGVSDGMSVVRQLASVGIAVVTVDCGLIGNGLFNAFHLGLGEKKVQAVTHAKDNSASHFKIVQEDDAV